MSEIYVLEPPTTAKVVLRTTHGDLDVELWARECPATCRAFVQRCVDGRFDDVRVERIVKDLLVEFEPTAVQDDFPRKIEKHPRLKFRYRGIIGFGNLAPDTASSPEQQRMFITLGRVDAFNGKHTLFAKVTGHSLYNLVNIAEGTSCDAEGRPGARLAPAVLGAALIAWTLPGPEFVPRAPARAAAASPSAARAGRRRPERPLVRKRQLLSFDDLPTESDGTQGSDVAAPPLPAAAGRAGPPATPAQEAHLVAQEAHLAAQAAYLAALKRRVRDAEGGSSEETGSCGGSSGGDAAKGGGKSTGGDSGSAGVFLPRERAGEPSLTAGAEPAGDPAAPGGRPAESAGRSDCGSEGEDGESDEEEGTADKIADTDGAGEAESANNVLGKRKNATEGRATVAQKNAAGEVLEVEDPLDRLAERLIASRKTAGRTAADRAAAVEKAVLTENTSELQKSDGLQHPCDDWRRSQIGSQSFSGEKTTEMINAEEPEGRGGEDRANGRSSFFASIVSKQRGSKPCETHKRRREDSVLEKVARFRSRLRKAGEKPTSENRAGGAAESGGGAWFEGAGLKFPVDGTTAYEFDAAKNALVTVDPLRQRRPDELDEIARRRKAQRLTPPLRMDRCDRAERW